LKLPEANLKRRERDGNRIRREEGGWVGGAW